MRRLKVNVKVDSRREILPQDTSKMDGKDWQEKQYLTAWQEIEFLSHGEF